MVNATPEKLVVITRNVADGSLVDQVSLVRDAASEVMSRSRTPRGPGSVKPTEPVVEALGSSSQLATGLVADAVVAHGDELNAGLASATAGSD